MIFTLSGTVSSAAIVGKKGEIDMLTIISGIFGGVLRLVPELFKFLNAKADRKHELDMQKVAYDFQVLKGNQQIDEIREAGNSSWDVGAMETLRESIKAQAKPSGVKWIDGFSALIRPLITFQWVILLYPTVIGASFYLLIKAGDGSPAAIASALIQSFGESEKALVAFIVDFWFVGRVLEGGRNRVRK